MKMWQASSAYLYVLHLDHPALAWEYLRRNPDYRQQWCNGELTIDADVAARWACSIAENPDFDSRVAQPCWVSDPLHVISITAAEKYRSNDHGFSMWSFRGRRSLVHTGKHLALHAVCSTHSIRMRLDDSVVDGNPFAYVIRADESVHERLQAVSQHVSHQERLRKEGAITTAVRFHRNAMIHARTLQAVDGVLGGATQRDIAIALFGEPEVLTRWTPDSELRAQVRYLIRRGRELMNGGYRSLLSGSPRHRQGESST